MDVEMGSDAPQASASERQIAELTSALEHARSSITRLEVEHESTLNDLQSQLSATDAAKAQAEEAGRQLEAEKNAKNEELSKALDEVAKLKKASTEGNGRDVEVQKQLGELEKEKRNLLAVLDEREIEKAELQADLAAAKETLASNAASLRTLETSLASSSESERSIRLKLQGLELELNLAQSSKQFFADELAKGKDEWQQARAASHSQVVKLDSQLQAVTEERDSYCTTANTLRVANAELASKLQDSLSRVRDLSSNLAESEATFRAEIEASKRLVMLMEKREQERSKRMDDIEAEWEARKAEAEAREVEAREAIEREKRKCDELERRLHEMRELTERRLGSSVGDDDGLLIRGSRAGTPLGPPGTPGNSGRIGFGAGMLALSPAAALASKMQRQGMSVTEVYGQLIATQDELAKERAEVARLSECLAQILAEIEDRAPAIQEQRAEVERMRMECDALTSQLTRTMEEHEAEKQRAEGFRADYESAKRDATVASQQLHDLSRQVRTLTKEIARRDDPSITLRSGEHSEDADVVDVSVDLEDPEDVMQAHLITFKNISELQSKNQQLVRIARELSQQLNADYEARAAAENREANEAVEEAHELILQLKEDLDSSKIRVEALTRERDMFRRMIGQSNAIIQQASGDDRVTNGAASGGPSGSQEPLKDLLEVQAQFDAYKMEMTTDSARVREELQATRAHLSTAQIALGKANAQIEYDKERYKLLSQTAEMQAQQNNTITDRMLKLQQDIARGEVLLHRANETVTEWQGKHNILKHNHDTLVAEKEVWKGVEARLQADNLSLSRERNNINDILRNVQSMQTELERTSGDARRRLEQHNARLETQVQELRERLRTESENVKQATLQRELETRDYQSRLDKLTADHSAAREALTAASTAKEHLETRVQDLSRQVAAKEEKLAIYEGRTRGSAAAAVDPSLTKEQQLEMQLADLRAQLREAQDEAQRARGHAEQYKAIAQSTEEALASLTATHDEYKASQESVYASKETELTALQEHLHRVTEDLTTANSANDELQRLVEGLRAESQQITASLQSRLEAVQDIEQIAKQTESDLKLQITRHAAGERANHEKYLLEVDNHGQTVKELKEAKRKLEEARAERTAAKAQAQAAKTNLETSTASWEGAKAVLQKQVQETSQRCDDLVAQNNLLHDHLQTATSQTANIERAAAAGGEGDGRETDPAYDGDSLDQLRGVIRYLRSNSDIAQRQVELAKLEGTRLSQKLEQTSRALDQARTELTQEREKSRQTLAITAEHKHLLDQINELNLIRESNANLRESTQQAERQAKKLSEKLTASQAKIQPLERKVVELEATVTQLQQEIQMLNEDNDRWKLRNQQILEKYDRVDPAELQLLKEENIKLTNALSEAQQAAETRRVKDFDRFKALQAQTRALRDRLEAEKVALQSDLDQARGAEAAAQAAVSEVKVELEAARAANVAVEHELEKSKNEVEAAAKASSSSLTNEVSDLRAKLDTLEKEKTLLEDLLATLRSDKATLEKRAVSAEADQVALATLQSQAEALQRRESSHMATGKKQSQRIKDLEKELAETQTKFVADNRTAIDAEVVRLANTEATSGIPQEEVDKLVKAKVDEAVAGAVADRQAAIDAAIAETTTTLRVEFAAAQAEAGKKAALESAVASASVSDETIAQRIAAVETTLREEARSAAAELEKKHRAELETAVAEAREKALAGKPAMEDGQIGEESVAAHVDAALAKQAEAYAADKTAALEKMKENLKREHDSATKLMRNMLSTARSKEADLKAKVEKAESALKAQTEGGSTPAASTSKTATASLPAQAQAQVQPARTQVHPLPAKLPAHPIPQASGTGGATTARGGVPVARGGAAGRGQQGRRGRGGAPPLPAEGRMAGIGASGSAAASGVSIKGAAGKGANRMLGQAIAGSATGGTPPPVAAGPGPVAKRGREEVDNGPDGGKRTKGPQGVRTRTQAATDNAEGA